MLPRASDLAINPTSIDTNDKDPIFNEKKQELYRFCVY